jgi:hypothetical protein
VIVAINGCRHFLRQLGAECAEEAAAAVQVNAVLQTIWKAQYDPRVWAQVMPDEREVIGEFLVILGDAHRIRAQTMLALPFLLLAGALLPQADVIDIPEFELVTRALGEQALREPVAFVTLEMLLTHRLVRERWEFLEATLEALGRVPIGPALACIATLKTVLPRHLPAATQELINTLRSDLERTLGINGQTAALLRLRVYSQTDVRFVVTAPFPRAMVKVLLDQMIAIVVRWQLQTVGMADPEPSTPETELLTDALEEGLIDRFLTAKRQHCTKL